MCGILVVISKDGPLDRAACGRALSTMYWRGPDFAVSRLWDRRLFLGQTVLSITGDPRQAADTYHRSASDRYEVLYNGQLYNFRQLDAQFLQSRPNLAPRYGTDTEVLANLHEVMPPPEVPTHLDGMYAYAVFDAKERRIHFARDVQGEKSLYVYEDSRQVIVASEIRAILTLVPRVSLDAQTLRDYFRTRHLMLLGKTVYSGIREIQPGHFDTIDLESFEWSQRQVCRLHDWLDPQRMADNGRRSLDDLAEELDTLLDRCVAEMIPTGRRYAAVVSGGVDSSLLTRYLVTRGNPELLVAVNHAGKDRLSADLSGYEKALGCLVRTLEVDAGAYAAEIGRCQHVCGSPLPSHSFVPQSQQSALVRAAGCRVLFGGDGADELFGGYEAYWKIKEAPGPFSPSPYTGHTRPLLEFLEDTPETFRQELADIWSGALDSYRFIDDRTHRIRQAMMYCDGTAQLPSVGLRSGDLMSMMWSVETRSPYLRRPVLQFALNLPSSVKADDREQTAPLLRAKPLLKRVFLKHFPAPLLGKKQGFGGFPNESAAWLGEPVDYRVLGDLAIDPASLPGALADRATAWKLINVEYFLRQSPS